MPDTSDLRSTGRYFRRRLDVHKKLMLFATVIILDAAVARWPFAFVKGGPAVFFAVIDLFLLACVLYDLATRRRVHPATLWGGTLIVISQPLRLVIGRTHAWITFADWLTDWIA